MIIPLKNGWCDKTSECPIFLLISKGDWEVFKINFDSPIIASNGIYRAEVEFQSLDDAKRFVDDFYTSPSERKQRT